MDIHNEYTNLYVLSTEDISSELDAWFSVSGDMDDFIYFEDTCKKHSEK